MSTGNSFSVRAVLARHVHKVLQRKTKACSTKYCLDFQCVLIVSEELGKNPKAPHTDKNVTTQSNFFKLTWHSYRSSLHIPHSIYFECLRQQKIEKISNMHTIKITQCMISLEVIVQFDAYSSQIFS